MTAAESESWLAVAGVVPIVFAQLVAIVEAVRTSARRDEPSLAANAELRRSEGGRIVGAA